MTDRSRGLDWPLAGKGALNGLVFVGPTAEALRQGGDKLEAKRIAQEAGVPVLPAGDPDEVGFPLVVKATAGGGGRDNVLEGGEDAFEDEEEETTGAIGGGGQLFEPADGGVAAGTTDCQAPPVRDSTITVYDPFEESLRW